MSAIVEELAMPPERAVIEASPDETKSDEQEAIYYPITQRDPNDVRTILRLAVAALAFAVLSLTLAGLLVYKLTRSASLVVVERTPEGDRVVGDDQHYTLSGPVQVLAGQTRRRRQEVPCRQVGRELFPDRSTDTPGRHSARPQDDDS